jgi:hypothetical protein
MPEGGSGALPPPRFHGQLHENTVVPELTPDPAYVLPKSQGVHLNPERAQEAELAYALFLSFPESAHGALLMRSSASAGSGTGKGGMGYWPTDVALWCSSAMPAI